MAVLAVFLPIGSIFFSRIAIVTFSSNVSFSFFPSSLISSSDFFTVFSDTSLSDTGTRAGISIFYSIFCILGRALSHTLLLVKTRARCQRMRLRNRRDYSGRVKCQTVLINFPYSSSNTDIPFDQHLSTRMEPPVLVYSSIQQSCFHGVGLLNRFSINAAKPAFFCVLLFSYIQQRC